MQMHSTLPVKTTAPSLELEQLATPRGPSGRLLCSTAYTGTGLTSEIQPTSSYRILQLRPGLKGPVPQTSLGTTTVRMVRAWARGGASSVTGAMATASCSWTTADCVYRK